MEHQITVREPQELARTQEPSPMSMIAALVNSPDVTAEKVAIAEKLIAMRREMKADEAKEEFVRAFVKMQRQMKAVKAVRKVRNEKGELMYTFAAFEDIREQADPILTDNGFAFSFDTKIEGDRMISIFKLMHEGGHSQENQFACRFSGPPKTNASQADMSTKSYAMRGAFCDGCGIVISKDTDGGDARGLGGKITPEQASALERRAKASGASALKLLGYAGAGITRFEDIDEAMLSAVDGALSAWEVKKGIKPLPNNPGSAPCDDEGNLI